MPDKERRFKVRIGNGNHYLFAVNKRGATVTIDQFHDAPLLTEATIEEYKRRMSGHSLSKSDELTRIKAVCNELPE